MLQRRRHVNLGSCHSRWRLLLVFLLGLAVLAWVVPLEAVAEEVARPPQAPRVTPQGLWEKAQAAGEAGKLEEASYLFERVFREFPGWERSGEALWRAAVRAKEAAQLDPDPDWGRVKDLFRTFAAEYPNSARSAEAFFEIGLAHYHMRFYREALSYFKLFAERYPDSPLIPKVRYWEGRTLMDVGRYQEAAQRFQEVLKTAPGPLAIRAWIGAGQAYEAMGDFAKALAAYENLLKRYPKSRLAEPELLYHYGQVFFRLGREEEGREQLFAFVNIAPDSPKRAEALFELGESYHREGKDLFAQKLYGQAVEEGEPGERAVVLARFRQAQYHDDPLRKRPKWQQPPDLTDPAGDLPYLAVLDGFSQEPIAQDARYGLYLRYLARGDKELAMEMGRSFLRHDPPGKGPGEREDRGCEVIVRLVEELFERNAYERIYELYQAEFDQVEACGNGRLRYLIGRAFEEKGLYPQAAVVYYRALASSLTDQDKTDLYFRRAALYLAMDDLAAADRLLAYLRKIYADRPEIARVLYLSGRLSQRQGNLNQAVGFFARAVEHVQVGQKEPEFAEAFLKALLAAGRLDQAASVLVRFFKEGWLAPETVQSLVLDLGSSLETAGRLDQAEDLYRIALDENMPVEGEAPLKLTMRLAGLLAGRGAYQEARELYRTVISRADPFTRKAAEARLNQLIIDEGLSTMQALFDAG